MLREFSTRENSIEELQVSDDMKASSQIAHVIGGESPVWSDLIPSQNVPAAFSMGPDEMVQYLTLKQTHCEKLQLPVAQPHTH